MSGSDSSESRSGKGGSYYRTGLSLVHDVSQIPVLQLRPGISFTDWGYYGGVISNFGNICAGEQRALPPIPSNVRQGVKHGLQKDLPQNPLSLVAMSG